MGKAKPAHHTSAELKAKAKASTQNVGGGKAGKADRKGGVAGHQKFRCARGAGFVRGRVPPPCALQGDGAKVVGVPCPCVWLPRHVSRPPPPHHFLRRCNVCGLTTPDLKTAQIHFEAKHPKMTFDPDTALVDVHAQHGGVTTQVRCGGRVALRGSCLGGVLRGAGC